MQIGVEMDTLATIKPWPKLSFEVREIGGVMLQLWPQYFAECGILLVRLQSGSSVYFSLQNSVTIFFLRSGGLPMLDRAVCY